MAQRLDARQPAALASAGLQNSRSPLIGSIRVRLQYWPEGMWYIFSPLLEMLPLMLQFVVETAGVALEANPGEARECDTEDA